MSKVNIADLIERLRALRNRNFDEYPSLAWADYLNVAQKLCLAEGASIYGIEVTNELVIKQEAVESIDSYNERVESLSVAENDAWFKELITRAMKNGFSLHHQKIPLQQDSHWLCVRLACAGLKVLLLKVADANRERIGDILLRSQMLSDVPTGYVEIESSEGTSAQSLSLLSVLPDVYSANTLALTGYTLVNGFVTHADIIDQAALGWVKGEYVKIENISHFDRFEDKTELVKLYEAALEEAVDQQATIHLQGTNQEQLILLAHQQLQRAMACEDLLTIVIFDSNSQPLGSVLFVKMSGTFDSRDIHSVSFTLSLLGARIEKLMEDEGGFRLKAKKKCVNGLKWFLGKDWLWAKVVFVLFLITFLWSMLGSLSFRIESSGEFVTDNIQIISAPQDGVIIDVLTNTGESVTSGQTVLSLKKQDLILQLTELNAEKQRYSSEADKARASFNIVETEIAKARSEQVNARIARIQLMLNDTDLKSPFDGVIIEGERKDLLGLPVRKGDPLIKVAKIKDIYLTLAVDEQDIHLVSEGDLGEFALVSQPFSALSFVVEQIIPVADDSGQTGAKFKVRARFIDAPKPWWRPGMTGVGKIDKGDEAPYWVLGRKTYNQLRMMFWW